MKGKFTSLEDTPIKELEGRRMYMLITPKTVKSDNISMMLIKVKQGQTVRPCHSHPTSEEIIYIIQGEGEAWIDEEIFAFTAGTAIIFPKGAKHMIRNTGNSKLEVLCVFSPPVTPESYQLFRNIGFKEEK